jgi:hypothetical protein
MPPLSNTIRVVAAGAALSLSACDRQRQPTGTEPLPPPDNPPAQPGEGQPELDAAPEQINANPPPPQALPTWESVRSSHPEGATNPPSPLLIVTEDGTTCYKDWRSGMQPPDPQEDRYGGWVIAAPDPNMGTQVICPPDAAEVLAAWRAHQDELNKDSKKK